VQGDHGPTSGTGAGGAAPNPAAANSASGREWEEPEPFFVYSVGATICGFVLGPPALAPEWRGQSPPKHGLNISMLLSHEKHTYISYHNEKHSLLAF